MIKMITQLLATSKQSFARRATVLTDLTPGALGSMIASGLSTAHEAASVRKENRSMTTVEPGATTETANTKLQRSGVIQVDVKRCLACRECEVACSL